MGQVLLGTEAQHDCNIRMVKHEVGDGACLRFADLVRARSSLEVRVIEGEVAAELHSARRVLVKQSVPVVIHSLAENVILAQFPLGRIRRDQ